VGDTGPDVGDRCLSATRKLSENVFRCGRHRVVDDLADLDDSEPLVDLDGSELPSEVADLAYAIS